MKIYIIVGLGNPGKQYDLTRHNVGFMIVDACARALHAPKFDFKKKSNSLTTQTTINDQLTIILTKPQTFMNLTGTAVRAMLQALHMTPASYGQGNKLPLLVISDDLDLPLGTMRLRTQGSAGGHNGLQSIIESLDTKEFPRLRIGIRPPGTDRQPGTAEEFVLKRFTSTELSQLKKEIIPHAVDAIIAQVKSQYPTSNFDI